MKDGNPFDPADLPKQDTGVDDTRQTAQRPVPEDEITKLVKLMTQDALKIPDHSEAKAMIEARMRKDLRQDRQRIAANLKQIADGYHMLVPARAGGWADVWK